VGPILDGLGKQVQDPSLPESERLQIVKTLASWGTAQVRAPLVAILKDPSPAIRAAAARALGWRGNLEAVSVLREHVERSSEPAAVRAAALEALGEIGDPSTRPVVLAAVRDPDDAVRRAALWGLTFGALVDPADRAPLLRQAAEDRTVDLAMRCQAIQALGEAQDTAAVELLARLVEQEPPIPMPLPRDGANQQELMMVRYRQARDVRAWAARSLGVLEAKTKLPLLLKTAEDPRDFFLRLTSVESLVYWKAREALGVLVRRLEDPFPDTRIAALVGLSEIGDRAVVDPVLARLDDKLPAVRVQAIATLAALGDARVRPYLESLRERDTDPSVQDALDKALAQLGG
jgi:HEAT repeat protein